MVRFVIPLRWNRPIFDNFVNNKESFYWQIYEFILGWSYEAFGPAIGLLLMD